VVRPGAALTTGWSVEVMGVRPHSKKKNKLMFVKDENLLNVPRIQEQGRIAASVLH